MRTPEEIHRRVFGRDPTEEEKARWVQIRDRLWEMKERAKMALFTVPRVYEDKNG